MTDLLLIAPVLLLGLYGMVLMRRKVVSRLVVRGFLVVAMVVDALLAGVHWAQGERWAALINLVCVALLAWVLWFHVHRLRQLDAATQLVLESLDAPRPEGVTVLRADGTELPCELVYQGRDYDGMYQWSVAGMVLQPNDRLYVAVLPAKTGIDYEVGPPDEGMPC